MWGGLEAKVVRRMWVMEASCWRRRSGMELELGLEVEAGFTAEDVWD